MTSNVIQSGNREHTYPDAIKYEMLERTWNNAVSVAIMLLRFSLDSLVLKGLHRTTTWTHSCFFSSFFSDILQLAFRPSGALVA